MIVLRTVLFLASLLGYLGWLSRRMLPEFVPAVLFSSIGCLMLLAALCGASGAGAVAVCLTGLLLLGFALRKRESFRGLLCFSNGFLLVLCLYFLWNLYGIRLTGYDDFSHWGVITRILITQDRLPDSGDVLLSFQSYPPGTALLIYWAVKIVGINEEWFWLYTQAVLTMSMYMGLFAFTQTRRERWFMCVCILILLCSNTFFINLLVDGVVTAAALGSMCFCLWYTRTSEGNRVGDRKAVLFWLIPQMAFLLLVKNSGVFFALIPALYLLFKSENTEDRRRGIVLMLLSLVPVLLWRWHVRSIFPEGMLSKHALSWGYLSNTITDKTVQGMKYILAKLLNRLFSPKTELVWLLAFSGLAAYSGRSLLRRRDSLLRAVLSVDLLAGLFYVFFLYLMYLFAMPWYEASLLAGFERYLRTFTAYACGLMSLALPEIWRDGGGSAQRLHLRSALMAGWVLLIALSMGRRYDFYLKWPMDGEPRTALEAVIAEHSVLPGKNYLIVIGDENEDREYLQYMARYVLNSEQVTVLTPEELHEKTDCEGEADYVIAWDWNDEIREQLSPEFGLQPDRVIALEKVTEQL